MHLRQDDIYESQSGQWYKQQKPVKFKTCKSIDIIVKVYIYNKLHCYGDITNEQKYCFKTNLGDL